MHFLGPARTNGNCTRPVRERRGSPRRLLAVPIRVRPEQVPWFEETMSLDFSARGMRFRSNREYTEGEVLGITFEAPSPARWPGPVEFRAKVVRVFPQPTALGWTLASAEQLSVSFNISPSMRYTQKKNSRAHP
jgi:hypothetical protein